MTRPGDNVSPADRLSGEQASPNGASASGEALWADAMQALALFAIDPAGLGGISLRAGAGPVRDHWLALLKQALPPGTPLRRLPLHTSDERLLGGLDLAATLQAGRPVAQKGLLAEADGGVVVLAMAERIEPGTAARLRAVLDDGAVTLQRDGLSRVLPTRFGLIALDEGADADERPPASLLDRLAFHLDLTEVSARDIDDPIWDAGDLVGARKLYAAGREANAGAPSRVIPGAPDAIVAAAPAANIPAAHSRVIPGLDPGIVVDAGVRDDPQIKPGDDGAGSFGVAGGQASASELSVSDSVQALCGAAHALGIDSLRAPLLAMRAARAAAALGGRAEPTDADLGLAARLVFVSRATRFPAPQDAEQPEPPPEPPPPSDADPDEAENDTIPDQPLADVVLEAAVAALPPDLLDRLARLDNGRGAARAPGRAGQTKLSLKRGRPVGTRQGDLKGGARLHLLETLKAAAPWQTLRRRTGGDAPPRFEVRRDDFRIIRFRQRIGTTTVFAVDASGSAAMQRLGEAKGAVELLLADCYVRRDQVALIAFRGHGAQVLLPPTGSLLRAKRSLAGLPGGGPTPLAAGIDAALALADQVRRTGRTPVITILTDGRANIGRDGGGGRPKAEAEALEAARMLRASGVATLLVDTSPRPNPFARKLADEMRAHYVPLPYADPSALSRAVRAAAA